MVPSVNIGILAGMVSGLWLYLQYYSGFYLTEASKFNGLIAFVILFGGIYLAIARTRESESNGGYISYREGLKAGLTATALNAIILSVLTYIFYSINPDYIEVMVKSSEKFFLQQGVKMKDVLLNNMMIRYRFEFTQALTTLLSFILIGGVFSFIAAGLLRRQAS